MALMLRYIFPLLTLWHSCHSAALEGGASDLYYLANDTNPYEKYASKTAYNLARGSFSAGALVPEGCQATQVWHLIRHGTRYPSNYDILAFELKLPGLQRNIIEASESGKGELCAQDVANLKDWSLGDLNVTWNLMLAPEGELELQELSARYKAAIPDLLDLPFSNESFEFRHTATQRTETSARAYARGLFGDEGSTIYIPEPLQPDPLIRFYKVCSKYIQEVENNAEATIEAKKFTEGLKMAAVVEEASRRLGINVTFADVEVLYDACCYYKAWDPLTLSAWCAAFTPENLKVMEYWQDLKYYYEDGYGHAINYESACPPLQDLIQQFRNVVETGKGPRGIFYFSHSSLLNKMTARLGLYEDSVPLTHDHIDPDRLWKTSTLGIFATNFAFTLSNCGEEKGWWVSLMMSETAVQLPGCPSEEGCSWEEFLQFYGQFEECDFDTICENHKDSKTHFGDKLGSTWYSVGKNMKQLWHQFLSLFG